MSDTARWRRTWWAPGGTEESLGRGDHLTPRMANTPLPSLDRSNPTERVLYGPTGERLVVQEVNPIGFRLRDEDPE